MALSSQRISDALSIKLIEIGGCGRDHSEPDLAAQDGDVAAAGVGIEAKFTDDAGDLVTGALVFHEHIGMDDRDEAGEGFLIHAGNTGGFFQFDFENRFVRFLFHAAFGHVPRVAK